MSNNEDQSSKIVFGCMKSSGVEEHVEDLFSLINDDEYHSVKKAVIASQSKLSRPKLKLPDFISNNPEYRHGVTTSTTTNETAKQLIYCANENVRQYKENSGNNTANEPGKQKSRDYNWPTQTNPETTVFGIKNEGSNNMMKGNSKGVSEALCMPADDSAANDTISTKTHDPNQVFGKSTSLSGSSTADCLQYTKDATAHDDIGKSLTPGYRNAVTSRSFGCPSIRTDIPKYEQASVADCNNYGDSVDAGYLLRPSLLSSFGLEEDEFDKPRDKEFLKNLFTSCGMVDADNDDKFEEIFTRLADDNNLTSIKSLKVAFERG